MSILLVELGELVEVVVVDSVATFDRVQLLTSRSEVETLFKRQVSYATLENMLDGL